MTQSVGWTGGGGFQTFRLGPSLLEPVPGGWLALSRRLDRTSLRAALCRTHGFEPVCEPAEPWCHGRNGASTLLHVASEPLAPASLQALNEATGPTRHTLVLATAFSGDPRDYPNLTITKLRSDRLPSYDWNRDSYDLPVSGTASVA